jgi:Peptidase family S41/N-terminal domain of Peptidase_S41 in eukaryotic IRBP
VVACLAASHVAPAISAGEPGSKSPQLMVTRIRSEGPSAVAGTALPNTPAGNALRSWLVAFNSGDRARIDSFDQAHAPWLGLPGMMQLTAHTGGYDLLNVEKSGRFWIVFRARARKSSTETIGSLVVRSWQPDHITMFSLVSPRAYSGQFYLRRNERTRVIDGAVRLLDKYYLFPQVARTVSAKLKALQERGQYSGITDGEVFAVRLGDDLKLLSGDKHIGVDFFAKSAPSAQPRRDVRWLAESNCGFANADHFAPNIGYLKLTAFALPEYCTRTAIAAMNFLADSDALIIDLRDNHGGAPQMVALIASYLFNRPTHLDDIEYRAPHLAEHLWTLPHVPGKKFLGKPVYVLTSSSTFSAAEEFAYDLKSLKRATLVGETTGGGAHGAKPYRIDAHFFIRVPFSRIVNPITKTDWEGTGVVPDVKVSAAQALALAEQLAATEIRKRQLHAQTPWGSRNVRLSATRHAAPMPAINCVYAWLFIRDPTGSLPDQCVPACAPPSS